jgi:exonuclease III
MVVYRIIIFLLFLGLIRSETDCPYIKQVEDRRENTSIFRYMQYNAEWLFMDYYASAECPGSGCPWENTTEAQKHFDHISEVIKDINPDFINICEVEGCDELNILRDSIDSGYQPYLIQGTDTSTGQNVGILTRVDPNLSLYRREERVTYPISGSTCGYTGAEGTTGVSKHYITEMEMSGIRIALIGAHLLAYPTDIQRCAQREAQAQILQNIVISYISKGYEVILSGDFNDFDGEIQDSNNNYPLSSVLDILKGYSGIYMNKYVLFSVSQQLEQKERYSDWWDKNSDCKSLSTEFSQIDHILVSEYLFERISDIYVYHDYIMNCETYESDHYPLVVDFLII